MLHAMQYDLERFQEEVAEIEAHLQAAEEATD